MSSSEEKNLPPTDKKLRDARKKGQVATYRDFTNAVVFIAAAGVLYAQMRGIQTTLSAGITETMDQIGRPFDEVAKQRLTDLAADAVGIVMPLLLSVVAMTILVNILTKKGFVFSTEALSPKLENLDPIKGLGRLFGVRSLIEFGKSLFKLASIGGVLWLIVLQIVPSLVHVPYCGFGCFDGVLRTITILSMTSAALIYLVIGAADIPLQSWLFLKDQKMSKTDVKQERKDQDGSPEIKSAQRRLRQEMSNAPPGRPSIERATLVIYGGVAAVALRFVQGETSVPLFMAKAQNTKAAELLRVSNRLGVALHHDEGLARSLLNGGGLGQPIKKRHFEGVAGALQMIRIHQR
ncbi:EscU/YscU/HrcU family type III secretion system export apparatus switch protein [Aestuariibius sp. 2305UL40-4]|uniref:EscU/YscU/HrcU family type III secretion system export apparatus switch protein n=1 Tax=Aestuariibius violaceus TaxID=3234132 RepID=UPI00345E4A4B